MLEFQTIRNQRIRHTKGVCQILHRIRVNIRRRKRDLQSSLASLIQVIWGSMEAISLDKTDMAPVLEIMPREKSSDRSSRKTCLLHYHISVVMSSFLNKMGESVVEIATNFIICKY